MKERAAAGRRTTQARVKLQRGGPYRCPTMRTSRAWRSSTAAWATVRSCAGAAFGRRARRLTRVRRAVARQGRTASGIEDATRAFRQAFAERVGASAFFKGMRGWLEQQVTQDNVVAWTLHDACFTEAAGDDFTR